MTTQISGDTGVSQCQPGSVSQDDLAANVVGNGPAFSATGTGSYNVGDNVWSKITILTTETFDTNAAFSGSRFLPDVAGYYFFTGFVVGVADAAVNNIAVAIYKNGLSSIAVAVQSATVASNSCSVAGLVYLNGTTDYVELYGRVTGGTSNQRFTGSTFSGFLARAA